MAGTIAKGDGDRCSGLSSSSFETGLLIDIAPLSFYLIDLITANLPLIAYQTVRRGTPNSMKYEALISWIPNKLFRTFHMCGTGAFILADYSPL